MATKYRSRRTFGDKWNLTKLNKEQLVDIIIANLRSHGSTYGFSVQGDYYPEEVEKLRNKTKKALLKQAKNLKLLEKETLDNW